ncbi:phage tail protein, partial [Salmonella enterica subsp. enterica serovar Oslo]|nr:phage tail protein [Salmonella enterica subsp. enterica serovar Oslo]
MSGLHGVETIELTSGTVAVETISTAVIGLVGTAPAAATATSSGGVVGSALLDNVLTFRAKTPGRTGNQLKVEAVPAVPDAQNPVAVPTSASYSGTTLSVVLGCDD